MPCAEIDDRLQAYFDGELDAVAAAAYESHLARCAPCHAALEELRELRTALRTELPYERAPAALAARIGAALDREAVPTAVRAGADAAANADAPRMSAGVRRAPRTGRAFWSGLAAGAGGAVLAAAAAFLLVAPRTVLIDELVDAHMRSLLPAHLVDVESTDRHTVKPWFAGHVDVSPAVYDFSAQGYRLIGGRADYFQHQRAAALVYQHGAHLINVFSWTGEGPLLKDSTRNGYRVAFWKEGNLHYGAVSDTGWAELLKLEELIRNAEAADHPG